MRAFIGHAQTMDPLGNLQIELFSVLIDRNPQPILHFTSEGLIAYANEASMPILLALGREPGQNLNEDWFQKVLRVLASGIAEIFELSEAGLQFEIKLVPCSHPLVGVNVLCRDITRERELERELSQVLQTSTQRDTVLAMITTYNHEINNPLAIALGYLRRPLERFTSEVLIKTVAALERIVLVTRKISQVAESPIQFASYAGKSEMLDLTDKSDAEG